METRANYILVGAFVLILFFGLIGFVLWLTRFQGEVVYDPYRIYFSGSVSGLQVGSRVTYRGVTVGSVRDIRIDPKNVDRISVMIEVQEDTPIKADTKASLQMEGLTGGVLVLLSGGSNEAPALKAVATTLPPVIQSQPSEIERLLQGAPTLVESIDVLVRQASDLLSPQNRAALTEMLENMRIVSAALAGQSGEIAGFIGNASQTMENLSAMSQSMTGLAKRLETDIPRTLDTLNRTGADTHQLIAELRRTADAATRMSNEVAGLVAENRAPLRDFTNTGLYEIAYFVNELRTLVASLNRVTTEVGRNPAGFIFGNQQHGYEAKQ